MKNRKYASGLRAKNIEMYKEMDRFLGHSGYPIHNDLGKFSSLETIDQLAVIAYRIAVDISASTTASMEKFVAFTGDYRMVVKREIPDQNALVALGIFLDMDPSACVRREGTALTVGKFIVINMNQIDLFFEA